MVFKVLDRIELVKMDNDPNPIEIGEKGIIESIQKLTLWNQFQINIKWDN